MNLFGRILFVGHDTTDEQIAKMKEQIGDEIVRRWKDYVKERQIMEDELRKALQGKKIIFTRSDIKKLESLQTKTYL